MESARSHGIRVIHQELMLIPYMTVAENIFLGQEPKTKRGTVDTAKMNRDTAAFLKEMELDIQPDEQVGRLNIAKQQMVEIARTISFGAKIREDEPTSSLKTQRWRFKAIRRLKERESALSISATGCQSWMEIETILTVMRWRVYCYSGDKGYNPRFIRQSDGRVFLCEICTTSTTIPERKPCFLFIIWQQERKSEMFPLN